MRLLAIDSGLERTGYSIFEKGKQYPNGFNYITSGLITTPRKLSLPKRLENIFASVEQLIKKHKPGAIVIEQLFFQNNQKTAISVSQSQGVIMLLCAKNNLTLEFLTPLQIKHTITGYGQADKKSIQKMLQMTLHLNGELKQDDQADAIACGLAYCYLNDALK